MPNTTIKQKKKSKEEMRNALRDARGVRDACHIFEDLYKTLYTNEFRRTPINVRKVINEAEAFEAISYLMWLFDMSGTVSSKSKVMTYGDANA